MWEKVDALVRKYHMLQNGDAVLVGLSGGADSVCLFRYLIYLRQKMQIRLFAVHVNHLLRGEEAERDEKFAEELCRQWEVTFAAVKKDAAAEKEKRHCSLEEAGRMIRYDCFNTFAEKWKCNKIAVAHHKNDLAETMLFRMARGTGIRGIAGIRPVTGNIIRPLLSLEKEEVCSLLRRLNQPYMEDSTNCDDGYSRNYIRLHLLPAFKEMNAGAVGHLGQISVQAAELMDYLEPVFQKLFEENVIRAGQALFLPAAAAQRLHPVECREISRRMLIHMAGRQKDISSVHVELLLGLLEKKEGKYREFPYNLIGKRTEEGILLLDRAAYEQMQEKENGKKDETEWVNRELLEKERDFSITFADKAQVFFSLREFRDCDIEKNDCVKYFDYDKIKSALCLRTRKTGDYFVVDKEGRHKSLKRYFIDEKIPVKQRDERILLAEDAHILWVLGGRISEAYKVTPHTRRVLIVRAQDKVL